MSSTFVTLEHCSVLLERLERVLTGLAGSSHDVKEAIVSIDTETMREELSELFKREQFEHLFQSELGKGVIIGSYTQLTSGSFETKDAAQLEFDLEGEDA